jgi:hypothetical protein
MSYMSFAPIESVLEHILTAVSRWGISLKLGEMLQMIILIICYSRREKSDPAFSSPRISLKLEGCKAQRPIVAQLCWPPLSIKWNFRGWSECSFKCIQFSNGPHKDVGSVPPRFSRVKWTLITSPRCQPFKVLFQPRINQIWPIQISHCASNEISSSRFPERMMIVPIIPAQISGYQRPIRFSREPFSVL